MRAAPIGAKRRLAFFILAVCWGIKLLIGFIGAIGSGATIYPDATKGFPSPYMGDVEFYLMIPAAFVFMNLLMCLLSRRLPKWFAASIAALEGLLLLTILLFSTGGI